MESAYSNKIERVSLILGQMVEACEFIEEWNLNIKSVEDFVTSPDGMQKMAASCMMIEAIGEEIKKIEKLMPDFLYENAPEISWHEIKGLRNHIAHGYFRLDADIVYDVVVNNIPELREVLNRLIGSLDSHLNSDQK